MPEEFAPMMPEHLDLHVLGPALKKRSLSDESKERLHQTLRNALNAELKLQGETLGLKPGDTVAISSSVGQSVSF